MYENKDIMIKRTDNIERALDYLIKVVKETHSMPMADFRFDYIDDGTYESKIIGLIVDKANSYSYREKAQPIKDWKLAYERLANQYKLMKKKMPKGKGWVTIQ